MRVSRRKDPSQLQYDNTIQENLTWRNSWVCPGTSQLAMSDFRQKEKKTLPQNKASRDESSLPRCNISSMAGSAAHGLFVNFHGLRRKKQQQKTRFKGHLF